MKKILLSLTTLPFAIGACGGGETKHNPLDYNWIYWTTNSVNPDTINWKNNVDFTKYSETWEFLYFFHSYGFKNSAGYNGTILFNFVGQDEKAKSFCDKYVSTLKTNDNESGVVDGYGTRRVMFITSFDAENKIFRGLSVRGENYVKPNDNSTGEVTWGYRDKLIDGYCDAQEAFEPLNIETVKLVRDGYGYMGSPYAEKYLESRFDPSAENKWRSIYAGDDGSNNSYSIYPRIVLNKVDDNSYKVRDVYNADKL